MSDSYQPLLLDCYKTISFLSPKVPITSTPSFEADCGLKLIEGRCSPRRPLCLLSDEVVSDARQGSIRRSARSWRAAGCRLAGCRRVPSSLGCWGRHIWEAGSPGSGPSCAAGGAKRQELKTLCIYEHTAAGCEVATRRFPLRFPTHFLPPGHLHCLHPSVEAISPLTKTTKPVAVGFFGPNSRNLSFVFSAMGLLLSSWNSFLFYFSVTVLSCRPLPFPLLLKCGLPPGTVCCRVSSIYSLKVDVPHAEFFT